MVFLAMKILCLAGLLSGASGMHAAKPRPSLLIKKSSAMDNSNFLAKAPALAAEAIADSSGVLAAAKAPAPAVEAIAAPTPVVAELSAAPAAAPAGPMLDGLMVAFEMANINYDDMEKEVVPDPTIYATGAPAPPPGIKGYSDVTGYGVGSREASAAPVAEPAESNTWSGLKAFGQHIADTHEAISEANRDTVEQASSHVTDKVKDGSEMASDGIQGAAAGAHSGVEAAADGAHTATAGTAHGLHDAVHGDEVATAVEEAHEHAANELLTTVPPASGAASAPTTTVAPQAVEESPVVEDATTVEDEVDNFGTDVSEGMAKEAQAIEEVIYGDANAPVASFMLHGNKQSPLGPMPNNAEKESTLVADVLEMAIEEVIKEELGENTSAEESFSSEMAGLESYSPAPALAANLVAVGSAPAPAAEAAYVMAAPAASPLSMEFSPVVGPPPPPKKPRKYNVFVHFKPGSSVKSVAQEATEGMAAAASDAAAGAEENEEMEALAKKAGIPLSQFILERRKMLNGHRSSIRAKHAMLNGRRQTPDTEWPYAPQDRPPPAKGKSILRHANPYGKKSVGRTTRVEVHVTDITGDGEDHLPDAEQILAMAQANGSLQTKLADKLQVAAGIKPVFSSFATTESPVAQWSLATCKSHMAEVVKRFEVAYTRRMVPIAIFNECTNFMAAASFSKDDIATELDVKRCKAATVRFANQWNLGKGPRASIAPPPGLALAATRGKKRKAHRKEAVDMTGFCVDVCEHKFGVDAPWCHVTEGDKNFYKAP